eukprot:maker-scaffold_9-snap-gene-6.51-mRNA-1 protein AED:0.00 eAED:0.00 QI:156/1/1/1/1/1/2/698/75
MSGIIDQIPATYEVEQYENAIDYFNSDLTRDTASVCREVTKEVNDLFSRDSLAAGSSKEGNIYLQDSEKKKFLCC